MPFIAILGCDGSGKSAVLDGVVKYLEGRGAEVTLGHWRPRPLQSEASTVALAEGEDPHGRCARGPLTSVAKLIWIWMNWWLSWWLSLRHFRRRGWVVFDRYHVDMIIDPRRYRYGGPLWLARLGSATMPQPDKVVFLDAPVEVLLSRKQEVTPAALRELRARYQTLCRSNRRAFSIDASQPLSAVIASVLDVING